MFHFDWEPSFLQEPFDNRPAGAITHREEDNGKTVVTQISGFHCNSIAQALIDNVYMDYGRQRQWNKSIDHDSANYDWENWPTEEHASVVSTV
jgi:hypothetical protein